MSQRRQIRFSMQPPPFSTIFANRIHRWSIELLMNIFVSLSSGIVAESPWVSSYSYLRSCREFFSSCPKLHNQVD